MKNIYLNITQTHPPDASLVLATVTDTRGSTPQKPGSSALFRNNSLLAGTVGGGMVENKVREHAAECSTTGNSTWLHFSLDNDISRKEEAICGGSISVIIDAEPLKHLSVFREMEKSLAKGTPGVLVTVLSGLTEPGIQISRRWLTAGSDETLPHRLHAKIMTEVNTILADTAADGFRQLELTEGEEKRSVALLEPLMPLPKLVIAGAGHIGKALSHLGRMLDFEVTVIDDRHEYANTDNLPDADHIIVRNIGDAMREIRKERNTYIVIVTRGHDDDAEALKPCIGSEAAYVGMIGSKAKVGKMHEEFIQRKWANEEQWLKIFTPIGLEIGSKTVEEIAVSIAAQLIQVKTKDKRQKSKDESQKSKDKSQKLKVK